MANSVRLVGQKGEQLGIMPFKQALELAVKHNLDLVEVAPTAEPPVCRLLDYGKYRYDQERRERESRRNQRVPLLRQVRMRPKIGTHDFDGKVKTVGKLLAEGDKVKVVVIFRGREIIHPEIGWRLLQKVAETLKEVASPEIQPSLVGRGMTMVLSPIAARKTSQESIDAKN